MVKLKRAILAFRGKWMLFCNKAVVDDVWAAIASAMATHQLGLSAKVSPRKVEDTASRDRADEHVACIYTADYTDDADVARVALAIAQAVRPYWVGTLRYKPDIYTYLGIYSGNQLGIAPTNRAFEVR